MQSYRELRVWQKAVDLTFEVYRTSKSFPKDEIYGLTAQVRRTAVSIAANIAEGHHLSMARGSVMELEMHLLIAERLEYGSPDELRRVLRITADVSRMLSGLVTRLRSSGWPRTEHRTPNTESGI